MSNIFKEDNQSKKKKNIMNRLSSCDSPVSSRLTWMYCLEHAGARSTEVASHVARYAVCNRYDSRTQDGYAEVGGRGTGAGREKGMC